MIFCRRFRACSGLGSPSFVVMIRRMCGFTSPSRSASRVRPFGAGLLPGLRRGACLAAYSGRRAPSAVLSAGTCARVRLFGAGLLPGLRRGACLAAHSGRRNPLAGLLAGACIPGPALRRRPFAGVSAVGRVSPRTPAGGTLRGSFRRNDLSKQGRPHKADGLRNVACRVICVSLPPARSLRRYRLCGCR